MTVAVALGLRRLRLALIGCLIALPLGGCDDTETLPASDTAVVAPPAWQQETPHWLEDHHAIAPEDWLLVRSHNIHDDIPVDPAVYRAILDDAASHFREGPRMIANRAIQLEDMLLEIGIEEGAASLIVLFSALHAQGTPHSFSAHCQYYFNLRSQGHDQQQALDALSRL